MSKRKRDEQESDPLDQVQDRAVRIKASRLKAKIEYGNKALFKAVQLARGFERQKLGRRQKQAESEPKVLLRLREEVIATRELDASKVARNYLFKQLVKTKRIKESTAFIALYGDDPKVEGPSSTAEGNVLGRIFKSNPVKEVLPEIMHGIKQILGIDRAASTKTQKKTDPVVEQSRKSTAGKSKNGTLERVPDDAATNSVDTNNEHVTSAEDSDFDMFNDRLAVSSDEEQDDTQRDDSEEPKVGGHRLESSSMSTISSAGEDSNIEQDPKPKSQKSARDVKQISSTAFLPSLSMGGYYSGSESEDDEFNPSHDPSRPKERNNRRGQRARQLIAEKKYGKEAKHLLNQKEKVRQKSGWDPKRGAVSGKDLRNRGFRKGGSARSSGANDITLGTRSGSRSKPSSARAKPEEPSLHPSWEAAKKRKEESASVPFSGKKITFD